MTEGRYLRSRKRAWQSEQYPSPFALSLLMVRHKSDTPVASVAASRQAFLVIADSLAVSRGASHGWCELALLRLVAACMLLIGVVFGSGCARSDDPTAPQPRKVYRDGFATPLSAVTIEADGGTIIGAFDAWLWLTSEGPLTPRQGADYDPIDCAPVRSYFARELALTPVAMVPDLVECRESINERLPFDNGRWLAFTPSRGEVLYRVWKYR